MNPEELADLVRAVPGVVRLQPALLPGLTAGLRSRRPSGDAAAVTVTRTGSGPLVEVRLVASLAAGPLAVVEAVERALLEALGPAGRVRLLVVDVDA